MTSFDSPVPPDPVDGTIAFAYDTARTRRTATFTGTVVDGALLGAYRALVAAPDYDVSAADLVDLRPVTHRGVTSDGMRERMGLFAMLDRLGVPTRLALVAPSDAVYGVSRMDQMIRGDDVPEEIAVFRDIGEAHAWLADGRAARDVSPAADGSSAAA